MPIVMRELKPGNLPLEVIYSLEHPAINFKKCDSLTCAIDYYWASSRNYENPLAYFKDIGIYSRWPAVEAVSWEDFLPVLKECFWIHGRAFMVKDMAKVFERMIGPPGDFYYANC